MRILVVGSAAVIVLATVGYTVTRFNHPDKAAREPTGPQVWRSDRRDTETGVATDSERTRESAAGRLALSRVARVEGTVDERLTEMAERLEAMEAAQGAAENAESPGMPHRELGDRMVESLSMHERNHQWESEAEQQIKNRLEELPDVQLETVACGERFCHMVFRGEKGAAPDITPILGAPPFDGEVMTQPDDPTGVVSVFVPARGVTIASLRTEAQASKEVL